MDRKAHGVVVHNTVILDESVPELEGRRVEVELRTDPADDDIAPSPAELQAAWSDWVASDNQGPLTGELDGWP